MLSAFVEISPELSDALETNGVLITANERLSREYKRAYDLYNQSRGKSAWVTPNVKSLSRFFLEQYNDVRQDHPDEYQPILHRWKMLSIAFEIEPDAPSYLIQNFVTAFEVCRGYQITASQIKAHHAGGQFFYDWSERFTKATNGFAFQQDIPRILKAADRLPTQSICTVLLEELNLNEQSYFDWACQHASFARLDNSGALHPATQSSELRDEPGSTNISVKQAYSAPSFGEEIRAAAIWASQKLSEDPNSRIGIIVPTLSNDHARVCEEVGLALNAEAGCEDARFDASGGETLAQQAVWQSAYRYLGFVFSRRSTTELEQLQASPYFSKLGMEMLPSWPRSLPANPSLKELARFANPEWLQLALTIDPNSRAELPTWVEVFTSLLTHAGWPNLSHLGSRQYQAYTALDGILQRVSAGQEMSARTALDHISLLLTGESFAPETNPANLLVLGQLEANGLSFDHLWVCGLDSESFPGRNTATPFIPRGIAKAAGVPRSDQDDELAFANRLIKRWAGNANELVVSFTRVAEDAERQLTHLLSNTVVTDLSPSAAPLCWQDDAPTLEQFSDDYGLPLPDNEATRGGVRLLEDQAACPIRSYGVHRLSLTRPETPTPLPDPLIRGILLHDALQALFTAATNKSEVQNVGRAEIELAIQQAIQRLSIALPLEFQSHEQKRLQDLIYGWLDVESLREEFDVYALESSYTLTLDRLQLTVRADRIDRLKSGALIVIDYKTGRVTASGITDAPIINPQLPVYSLVEEHVKGAFYASIRNDVVRFIGVADEAEHPGAARLQKLDRSWPEQLNLWRSELNRLAHDYVDGYAKVDPIPGACDYCHLSAFCRVNEMDS